MVADRGSRLFELFRDATGRTGTARAQFVDAVCAADPALGAELRALCAADSAAESLGLDGGLPGSLVAAAFGDTRAVRAEVAAELAALRAFGLPAGRFEDRGELGRGAMGRVEAVWDAALRRVVARKTLHAAAVPSDRRTARFLAEARVTGGLEHPAIVPVHDLGLGADGAVYFTMQRVQGRDLQQVYELERAARDGWTRARVLGVLQRVCEAMAYAHAQGVVHRDLKPANVMVGAFGEVYVMDWGIARVRGVPLDADDPGAVADGADVAPGLTVAGAVVGTPQFMSPEQAAGRADLVDERADVYAVGAMLYELLARHAPFADLAPASVAEWVRLVADAEPTPLPARGVPPELAAICQRAMERDRARRYPDMQALADDLRAFLEDRVVRAHRTGAFVELRKWVRRNRLAAAGIAATVAAVAVGGAVALAAERAATRANLQFDQLATVGRFEELRGLEAELYPAWPERGADIVRWLAAADELLAARAELDGVARSLAGLSDPTPGQRVLRDRVAPLLAQLGAFTAERDRVAARARWAAGVRAWTLRHPHARHDWDEVRASLGLPLQDQQVWGLVPIGRNPVTGLWEFYHLRSAWDGHGDPGALPIPVHRADGGIDVDADTGVVFVLLPGGAFRPGASPADPFAAHDEVSPAAAVELAPFFLARHELTQAQWARLWGGAADRLEPSHHRPGRADLEPTILFGATHPVEQVSWDECDLLARQHGLALPTEAQWEYASRAGAMTWWYTGDAPQSLCGHANLLDEAARRLRPGWVVDEFLACDDGHTHSAPVGSYAPNAFGLFDTIGNVAEWCRDRYGPYGGERPGDGLRPDGDGDRVNRGATMVHPPSQARCSTRFRIVPTTALRMLGVRLARALPPP
ncbi:MAG: bifunctional serine/threonine-protein kinase/formylglycine-generating enzyme family protein [Planctomycetota bacterium]